MSNFYPEPNKVFHHYKGGKYKIISCARHTETDEVLVVYQSISFGSVHARPLSIFNETIETVSGPKRRFSPDEEYPF